MLWDNAFGKERQPASADKYWASLTESEKAAAVLLGYIGTIWDNESGSEPQPVSAIKHWDELTSCGEAEIHFCVLCHSRLTSWICKCIMCALYFFMLKSARLLPLDVHLHFISAIYDLTY